MRRPSYFTSILLLAGSLAASLAAAAIGPNLVPGQFWVERDHPRLEELDPLLLERLAGLGIVQQLRTWPDSPIQEATTMALIQAPPDRVWGVLLEVDNRPQMVPEIYLASRIVKRTPDEVTTEESFRASVPPLSWNLQGSFHYRIDRPKGRMDFEMIAGDLKGSRGRLTLIPARGGKASIVIFRHYTEMREIDLVVKLFLKFSPQFSIPANMSEGIAVIRGVRRMSEKGLDTTYFKPPPWDQVDLEILEAISEHRLYIHQEKADGEPLCSAAVWKIPAPREEVWKVITDFEQWDKYQSQVGVKNTILLRKQNQVRLFQELSYKVFYIWGMSVKIEYEYNLSPPERINFNSPDPMYPGTHGEWLLRESDEGRTTYLVLSANIYTQKATGEKKMFGEAENPMPVRECQNMMAVQILGAPMAEQIAQKKRDHE